MLQKKRGQKECDRDQGLIHSGKIVVEAATGEEIEAEEEEEAVEEVEGLEECADVVVGVVADTNALRTLRRHTCRRRRTRCNSVNAVQEVPYLTVI